MGAAGSVAAGKAQEAALNQKTTKIKCGGGGGEEGGGSGRG